VNVNSIEIASRSPRDSDVFPARCKTWPAHARKAAFHALDFASRVDTALPLTKRGLGCGRGVPATKKVRVIKVYRDCIQCERRGPSERSANTTKRKQVEIFVDIEEGSLRSSIPSPLS
jgi:hypothetical protein